MRDTLRSLKIPKKRKSETANGRWGDKTMVKRKRTKGSSNG
jgi:hypothetical protein